MIKIRDDSPASLSGRLEVVLLRPLPGELLGLLIVRIVESVQDEADDALLPEAVSAELGVPQGGVGRMFATREDCLADNVNSVVVFCRDVIWTNLPSNIFDKILLHYTTDLTPRHV